MTLQSQTHDLSKARTLHSLDATKWLGNGRAYWLEWDHPGETPRSFASIVEGLEWVRWPQFIKPGSTAIDIGTHSGDTTIPMGLFAYDQQRRKKGAIIGVEPNPDLHKLVESCYALNEHIAHFYLEKCAVTDRDIDKIELADHGNANCNGGIIGDYNDGLKEELQKRATTTYKAQGKSLESIVNSYSNKIDPRDILFVKMDCEGYDKEIVRSSASILSQLKPTLFVEWFAWFSDEDSADLFSAIEEIGYVALHPGTLQRVDASGERLSDLTCVHASRLAGLER